MFRINTDLNSPNDLAPFRTLEQLFDPRQNPVPDDFHLNVSNWISFLQRIYTRENIIGNPRLFFSRLTNDHAHNGLGELFDAAAFINPIPDDQLWTLYFFHTNCWDSFNREHLQINPFISFDRGTHSHEPLSWFIYNYDTSTQRCTYSYKSEHWGPFVTPIVNKVIDSVNRYFVESRLGIARLVFSNSINPGIQSIMNYYTGLAYCFDDNDGYTRSSILNILSGNTEAQINISLPPSWHISVRNPISPTNRTPLYRTLSYSANPLDLLQWPIILKGEHNPLLYGVELEMSTDYPERDLVDAAKDMFFILKSDSSISGARSRRYELCTIPMSFKAHRQQWAYWFKGLDYEKFDQTKDTTNGMHVHISRNAFKQDHLRRFSWFFTQPAHQDFMRAVSERDPRSFDQYATLPHYPPDKVKSYLNTLDYAKKVRGCVNLSSKNTVEVRLFRGIVSLAEILKNLEFVDSVYFFTQDSNYQHLTLESYYAWLLKTHHNRYSLLKKYFQQIPNFDLLLASSDIHRIIHTERRPVTILDRVQKSMLQITNVHVTVLNRLFKKRVFILDKETGKLKLSQHNQGKLAFLDRSLEEKLLRNSPPAAPRPEPPVATEAAAPAPAPAPVRRVRRPRRTSVALQEEAANIMDSLVMAPSLLLLSS